ncbi:hypothetical protein GBAR_LOCUS27468 [Geodia barretti]|uniref:Secreted protein n=1 Tax=Geodia barretti TaxID=519541 RepID=A0AA35XFU0_GEOBA|nr:hypothetical protein GBAR_LOCUS27468 [Geodia barretti]
MKSVSSLLLLSLSLCAAAVGPPVQVVLQEIESVNGSNVSMGCTGPLTVTDGVTTCGSLGNGAISYLIDGVSPDIDTSTSNWASQLVTVRRNEGNANIPFDHVLLTFGFDTAVSLTGIEMDLFNCSDLNIGSSRIVVYPVEEYNLVFDISIYPFTLTELFNSSCDSLSQVTIPGGMF